MRARKRDIRVYWIKLAFFSRHSVFNFLQKKAFHSESLIFGYFCVCVSLSKDRH